MRYVPMGNGDTHMRRWRTGQMDDKNILATRSECFVHSPECWGCIGYSIVSHTVLLLPSVYQAGQEREAPLTVRVALERHGGWRYVSAGRMVNTISRLRCGEVLCI
jgi:hypothetical protein